MRVDVCSPVAGFAAPDFPVLVCTHIDDPEAIEARISRAVQAAGIPALVTPRQFDIRYHLWRTRSLIAVEVNVDQAATLSAWARRGGAILIYDDGSLRDPEGRVLIGPNAPDGDPGAEPPPPNGALLRKRRTEQLLTERGLEPYLGLPAIDDDEKVRLRTPQEVARRCLGLLAYAVRGECLAEGDPMPVSELKRRLPLAFDCLTPNESRFMKAGGLFSAKPTRQQVTEATWRYESLAALLWALGRLDDLPFPTDQCDVAGMTNPFAKMDLHRFVSEARLRPAAEILDAQDFIYRLHWIVVEARLGRRPFPDDTHPGIVVERHHALNWLTCYMDDDWDDVSADT